MKAAAVRSGGFEGGVEWAGGRWRPDRPVRWRALWSMACGRLSRSELINAWLAIGEVINSPLCRNCGKDSETALHALWECDKIQECWGLGFNKLRKPQLHLVSFIDLVSVVSQHGENLELFTVLAWYIWCRRNKWQFNELCLPPEKLFDAAESTLKEFQHKPVNRSEKSKPQPQRWSPPERGTYKVNYDGAYFPEEEEAGIGIVVRNELGQVMASLAEKLVMPSTVEVLEAMAARRAMIFMEELGLRRAIFEGDSELVVKALIGDCPDRGIMRRAYLLSGVGVDGHMGWGWTAQVHITRF
ncbi:hypothetical protein SO802_028442 [Lithocarpus litseifolius]|uniref:RNase H type-1 domain-containing protein n=1 Tax=Lithocarpus litseifolius TaxID=425828 RepID=A0AAW2BS61_9ROSI